MHHRRFGFVPDEPPEKFWNLSLRLGLYLGQDNDNNDQNNYSKSSPCTLPYHNPKIRSTTTLLAVATNSKHLDPKPAMQPGP